MNRIFFRLLALAVVLLAQSISAFGAITDFNTWEEVQDPPHALFTSSVDSASQISLYAGNGSVPTAVDIGYQSVNGVTPASSTVGYAFDPAASFQVAVDFSMSFQNSPTGGLGIGFGIGEDQNGENSAGAGLFTNSGSAIVFGAAARVNNANQPQQTFFTSAQLSGSFFSAYDASTGNITLGIGSAGAGTPTETRYYAGLQNSWDGGLLLTSFFLRSDGLLGQAWTSGNAAAVFSNFRIISGTPVAVPEPAALTLLALGAVAVIRVRRRRRA